MNFFEEYFIYPTKHLTGYNPVNTVAYTLTFVVVAYLFYKFLEKYKIDVNSQLVFSSLPFAFLAILYRLQVDYGVLNPSFLTVTPGCWFFGFVSWMTFLYIFKNQEKKFERIFVIGTGIFLSSLLFFKVVINDYGLFLLYVLANLVLVEILLIENFYLLAFFGEYIDALASYLGVNRGFFEEHVVSRILIGISPELYLLTKLGVTTFVLFILHKINVPEKYKRYVCAVVFILGYGPGSRNWFLLMQ